MGYSASWLAIKPKSPAAIRLELQVSETEQKQAFPEAMLTGAPLPNGWYLIFVNHCDSKYISDPIQTDLSKECEIVSCSIEEHVMYSMSQYWINGHKVWQVSHDAQQGMFNLESQGKLPENYQSIKSTNYSEQLSAGGENADVDFMFDIPLLLAKSITGFKHDEENTADIALEFTTLLPKNSHQNQPTKSWWKFW